jgi:hypothetical protein
MDSTGEISHEGPDHAVEPKQDHAQMLHPVERTEETASVMVTPIGRMLTIVRLAHVARDGDPAEALVVVTLSFKAKTRCSSYVCSESGCHTYDQNVSTENQCLYYIISYYKSRND